MNVLGARTSGVLLPISALPGGHGIGDLGGAALDFLDFLERAEQRVWQFLPIHTTTSGSGRSPYSAVSAFAIDPLLVAAGPLVDRGWLTTDDVGPPGADGPVDYAAVCRQKSTWFERALTRRDRVSTEEQRALAEFREAHAGWLDDYALFMVLADALQGRRWADWPAGLRDRRPAALAEARQTHADAIEREIVTQYLAYSQWSAFSEAAASRGIQLFGDMPMYVAYDSADVWACRDAFRLGRGGEMLAESGVPPDLYSDIGQLWRQPLLDWERLAATDYGWFVDRVAHELTLVDLLRIDHFRAVSAYFEVPAGAESAAGGEWRDGPGAGLLEAIRARVPDLPLVAEDLGQIDDDVYSLMDTFGIPGMRVLQFGFFGSFPRSRHLPHRYVESCVAYTGTHDNNTSRGWFDDDLTDEERDRVRTYTSVRRDPEVAEGMVRTALGSVALLAIVPLQDVVGLGSEARFNRPGETDGNWRWRATSADIAPSVADRLASWTRAAARAPTSTAVDR